MAFLIAFFLYVFAELAAFAWVGRQLGVLPTVGLAAASMLAGAVLVRVLGLDALKRAEAALSRGESPAGAVFDAACVALGGVLLILPGFLSDIVALALLIPALRRWIGATVWRRLQASPNVRVWTHSSGATVVEGEYVEIVEDRRLPHRPTDGKDRR